MTSEQFKKLDVDAIYYAVDRKGLVATNHVSSDSTIALSWGIFVGQQLVQPTVCNLEALLLWKDEAFGYLDQWESEYVMQLKEDLLIVTMVFHDVREPGNELLQQVVNCYHE